MILLCVEGGFQWTFYHPYNRLAHHTLHLLLLLLLLLLLGHPSAPCEMCPRKKAVIENSNPFLM